MIQHRTPEEFAKALADIDSNYQKAPPVNLWNPVTQVEVAIKIDVNGKWYYQDREIERKAMVRLFASILRKEDGGYCLVTPVEKAFIEVEDVPFLIVDWESYKDANQTEQVILHTNVDQKVLLSPEHPLVLREANRQNSLTDADTQEIPYILLGRGLEARVARSVFYQLVDYGEQIQDGDMTKVVVTSSGIQFELGRF